MVWCFQRDGKPRDLLGVSELGSLRLGSEEGCLAEICEAWSLGTRSFAIDSFGNWSGCGKAVLKIRGCV